MTKREDPPITVDLVTSDCPKDRIIREKEQPLILHVDNSNPMSTASQEKRLKEHRVLRSFYMGIVSSGVPFSVSVFHTLKYLLMPDYLKRFFQTVNEVCSEVMAAPSDAATVIETPASRS